MKYFYTNIYIDKNDDDIIKEKDVTNGSEKKFIGSVTKDIVILEI